MQIMQTNIYRQSLVYRQNRYIYIYRQQSGYRQCIDTVYAHFGRRVYRRLQTESQTRKPGIYEWSNSKYKLY